MSGSPTTTFSQGPSGAGGGVELSVRRVSTANNNNNKSCNSNLLSPNAAIQQRRKSTLSANGFFIDYSCTRRRSSARSAQPEDPIAAALNRNQFLRNVISPVRRPSAMLAAGSMSSSSDARNSRGASFCAGHSGPAQVQARARSRASYSSGCSSGLLHAHQPPTCGSGAARLAGSRKTSIFDPTGHSLAVAAAAAANSRRKSTMVTSGGGDLSPAAATMLAVSRQAAAVQKSKSAGGVAQRVPVIGCSPTSISASLAALEETRRYEKLLHKLKRHHKRKEKERNRKSGYHWASEEEEDNEYDDSLCDINLLSDDEQDDNQDAINQLMSDNDCSSQTSSGGDTAARIPRMSLRRKSIRAIKEAAAMLAGAEKSGDSRQRRRWHRRRRRLRHWRRRTSGWALGGVGGGGGTTSDSFVDGLSISSTLSFASSQTSLPSMDARFLAELSLCEEEDVNDDDDENFYDDDDESEDEEDNDHSSGSQASVEQLAVVENNNEVEEVEKSGEKKQDNRRQSLVGKAMRKLAAKLAGTTTQQHNQRRKSTVQGPPTRRARTGDHLPGESGSFHRAPARRRRGSVSMSSTGLNYWHYYYYLRANSLDATDCDLLTSSTRQPEATNDVASVAGPALAGGAPMSETERRARLYVNYSLARLDILNSAGDPVARLTDKLTKMAAAPAPEAEVAVEESQQQQEQLFDFSNQSTDVSLLLSTSSTSLDSTGTSRNSSSLSSPQSTTVSSIAIGGGRTYATTSAAAARNSSDSLYWQAGSAPPPQSSSNHSMRNVHEDYQTATTTSGSSGDSRQLRAAHTLSASSSPTQCATPTPGGQLHHHSRAQLATPPQMTGTAAAAAAAAATINDGRVFAAGRHLSGGNGVAQHEHDNEDQVTDYAPGATSTSQVADGHKASLTTTSSTPSGNLRAFGRDAHFRFSVKSSSSAAVAKRTQASRGSTSGPAASSTATTQRRRPTSAEINNTHQNDDDDDDSSQLAASRLLASGANSQLAAQRRSSRTFLSWDKLEMSSVGVESEENKRAHRINFSSGDHPANRRSFRQPKASATSSAPLGTTSSTSGGGERSPWRLSNLVSPSRSFLFPRKRATSVKTNNRKAQSEKRASGRREQPAEVELLDNEAARERQEQRRAADELLGEFEAQMSQAASLAAHSKHTKQQQQRASQSKSELSLAGGSISASSSIRLMPTAAAPPPPPTRKSSSTANSSAGTSSSSSMSLASSARSHQQRVNLAAAAAQQQRQSQWSMESKRQSGDSASSSATSSRRHLAPIESNVESHQLQLQVPEWCRRQQAAPNNHLVAGEPDDNRNDISTVYSAAVSQVNARLAAASSSAGQHNWNIGGWPSSSDNGRSADHVMSQQQQQQTFFNYDSGPRARAHSTGASGRPTLVGVAGGYLPAASKEPQLGYLAANSMQTLPSLTQQQHPSPTHSANYTTSGGHTSPVQIREPLEAQRIPEVTQPEVRQIEDQIERENQSIREHSMQMLRKSSFNCTVLGARQTGKRSIVICFVKLLDEFKLAADEYKKEKMLLKLVECSERLHELATKQQEQEEQEELEAQQRQRRTSRLNSWLPGAGSGGGVGGAAVKSLLGNLSPVGKRRLHSVANLWTSGGSGGQSSEAARRLPAQQNNASQNQAEMSAAASARRHTTFESPSCHQRQVAISDSNLDTRGNPNDAVQGARYLSVNQADTNLISCSATNNNKSDTNINYRTVEPQQQQQQRHSTIVHQLQVPSLEPAALRKHSDPGMSRSGPSMGEMNVRCSPVASYSSATSARSPGSVFLATNSAYDQRRRRHTTAMNGAADFVRRRRSRQSGQQSDTNRTVDQQRRASSSANQRRQSICLTRRTRRILLSLKDLNRRKFGIKFNTRRQISDAYLQQVNVDTHEEATSRRSLLMQLVNMSALPDSFLVVYSINDRDSFDYAKSLIQQLRSGGRREIPMPIVLVANKSDLERNREVKTEDGRILARKFACKFIEISCTIGFNLDNLLVGLRTQLVLRHHIILNSILRPGFKYKSALTEVAASKRPKSSMEQKRGDSDRNCASTKRVAAKLPTGDNILVRFYKRYVTDNHERNDYDCDNFSKL